MEFDFGGYATKNDVLCADGRTIKKNAFKTQDGQKVPLVWMHQRNDPGNVLGHAYLENRDDGVYAYCKFNNSENGKKCKLLVEHGDVSSLSIFANSLVQKGGNVTHGLIREVSLVIAPANPGALIDNPVVQHSDGEEYEDLTRATIFSGSDISLEDVEYEIEHAADSKTVKMKGKNKIRPEEDPDDQDDTDDEDYDEEDLDDDIVDDEEEESEMNEDKKRRQASVEHADTQTKTNEDEETVQDVYDTLTDKQKKVVEFIIGTAIAEAQKDVDEDDEAEQSDMEGDVFMPRNVFDRYNSVEMADNTTPSLSHDQMATIMQDAVKCGSFKESFLQHAAEYGFENIDVLFPDAKIVGDKPYMIKRDTEWVAGVLSETTHTPFSRIKSIAADVTADEARAKGYVKGNRKKEEVVKLLKRVTTPTTVYKKQKLDRDDVLDITEISVIAWMKAEMRVMLNEECARAILVSDGREVDDPDKINEENIRPIYKDDDLYAYHVILPADLAPEDLPEEILKAQEEYKGSGNPSFYSTSSQVLSMVLLKDKIGHRLYPTETELSSAIGVSKIVKVPVMERLTREVGGKILKLIGIIVNLRDYAVGTNDGGEVNFFDDFDIDFNQYKYLLETRFSGALIVPKSAIVIEQEVATGGMG